MATTWRPDRGMSVKDLGNNAFVFQFFHTYDLIKVLNDGPWSFMQHLLILKELKPREDSRAIEPTRMKIWVQVHSLHSGFMSETIGEYMGSFFSLDKKNFTGFLKEYMRVRISIDVCQPLNWKMQLSKRGVDWFWADFKYVRLPTFCYFCGVIGYTDRYCSKLYDLLIEHNLDHIIMMLLMLIYTFSA
uniref:DUF4283 domain-containing protein n=1 Tax=Manihot esculenta TaxID=3983 RepID=A0A2C9UNH0_MANES